MESKKEEKIDLHIIVTEKEKKVIEALTDYLYKIGVIKSPTINETMRYCFYHTLNDVLHDIEEEMAREETSPF